MFDDALQKLNDLHRRLERLHGQHKLPLGELFTDEFMLRNTDHPSVEAMFKFNGFEIKSAEDFEAIPEDEWDVMVKQQTRFRNWEAMQHAAAELWTLRQLKLG